jgi:hypothetical protein
MKKIAFAALMFLAPSAFAQLLPQQPMQQPAGQPMAAPGARFLPPAPKGQDIKSLLAAVKAHHDAWNNRDVNAISQSWSFPASVMTTDANDAPVYVQVDEAALKGALTAAFGTIPAPKPGEPSAKITFLAPRVEWLSNSLATVSARANLLQGKGKDLIHVTWQVTEVWTRDNGVFKIRGFVANGFGDVLRK